MSLTPSPLANALNPAFRALLDQIRDRYDRSRLRRLFAFASNREVSPDQINDAVLAAFGEAVLSAEIDRPKQVVRDAARAWNRAGDKLPGWPSACLTPPDSRTATSIAAEGFPESLRRDVEAYLRQASGTDLFDPRHAKALSPVTLQDRRGKIFQMATILVALGAGRSDNSQFVCSGRARGGKNDPGKSMAQS